MAQKFLVPIDLGKLELLNVRLQNLASAPSGPLEGLAYFDTTVHAPFFYNGTDWINAFAVGGAVAFADLTGKPTTLVGYGITDSFDGAYGSLTGVPDLSLKANLAGPTFTGSVTIPTPTAGNSSTLAASTAFVQGEITTLIGGAPGTLNSLQELAAAINDDASYASTLTTALATKAPLASPTFTGTPAAPTASPGTDTTQVATTAFVTAAVGSGAVAHKYATSVGDTTTTFFTITHNLNSRDLTVVVRENASPYAQVVTDVAFTTVNTATVSFGAAPDTDQYRVTFCG